MRLISIITILTAIFIACGNDTKNSVTTQPEDTTISIPDPINVADSLFDTTTVYEDTTIIDSLFFIDPSNPNIKYIGRFDTTYSAWWTGSAVRIKFKGTSLKVVSKASTNFYTVITDDTVRTIRSTDTLSLIENLTDTIHYVELFKRTESLLGTMYVKGFITDGEILPYDREQKLKIQFIGNSITCGYGNEAISENEPFTDSTENGYMTYAAITARNFDAEFSAICYSGKGVFQNYGGSKDDLIGDLYHRIRPSKKSLLWDTSKSKPDIFVINIGTNDFSNKLPDSTDFSIKYSELVDMVTAINPDAYIFCLGSQMMNSFKLRYLKKYIDPIMEREINENSRKMFYYELKPNNYEDCGYGADWHPNIALNIINAEELTDFISQKTGVKTVE